MNLAAVDPGVSGGLAFKIGRFVEAYAMPSTVSGLVQLFRKYCHFVNNVLVEQVGGYVGGGQPGSRMFTFGQNYGSILGVCEALGYRTIKITPQKWQRALNLYGLDLEKAERKRYFRKVAQKTYPRLKVTLKTADALLLLKYGTENHVKDFANDS